MSASCKQKGMSREEIQQESLARRQVVLQFIDQHGRVTMTDIEKATNFTRSVLFKWLRKMQEDGHVVIETEMVEHKRRNGGAFGVHPLNWYSRGENTDPLYAFAHGNAAPTIVPDMVEKRKITKAQQCGMPAYRDLPADFFRQVQA